jgi:hypothetical protein
MKGRKFAPPKFDASTIHETDSSYREKRLYKESKPSYCFEYSDLPNTSGSRAGESIDRFVLRIEGL